MSAIVVVRIIIMVLVGLYLDVGKCVCREKPEIMGLL